MTDLRTDKTTGDVLERLNRLGLQVTATMIEDDTSNNYLPPRDTAHRGRSGASGRWQPWMERRAERLYRLRALDRRTKHGPTGSALRLLLFISDGWGWEFVREVCIQGYRVNVQAALRGAPNALRGKALTLDNLSTFAEDIAEHQYRPEEPTQAQIDRVKMTLGLVVFGTAPDFKAGTIGPFVEDLYAGEASPDDFRKLQNLSPIAWTLMGADQSDALRILLRVEDEVIQNAIKQFRGYIWRVRRGFHRKITRRADGRVCPSNPLTMFGAAAHVRLNEILRRIPVRCTPAQALGGQVAHMIVITHREEEMVKTFEFMQRWVAYWLQSEECAQWLQRMESEISKAS